MRGTGYKERGTQCQPTEEAVPPSGLEPLSPAPEAGTLSTELRGLDGESVSNARTCDRGTERSDVAARRHGQGRAYDGRVSPSHDREMTLLEHLAELRGRFVHAAIAILVASAVSFVFAEQIIRFLLRPVGDIKLLAISPTEGFAVFMRVSLFTGIALAMPVILYQAYRYIDPALLPHERRFVLRMGFPVIMLFVLGLAFCYFILLPPALGFLTNFGAGVFDYQLRAAEYLSFVTTFLLALGLVFEMPAIIFALVRVRVLKREWLARQRRYMFLVSFLIAALITPTPDPFNQTLVGIPLYLLFELGLFLARFAEAPSRVAARAEPGQLR